MRSYGRPSNSTSDAASFSGASEARSSSDRAAPDDNKHLHARRRHRRISVHLPWGLLRAALALALAAMLAPAFAAQVFATDATGKALREAPNPVPLQSSISIEAPASSPDRSRSQLRGWRAGPPT